MNTVRSASPAHWPFEEWGLDGGLAEGYQGVALARPGGAHEDDVLGRPDGYDTLIWPHSGHRVPSST
jgi:hypothetical protein